MYATQEQLQHLAAEFVAEHAEFMVEYNNSNTALDIATLDAVYSMLADAALASAGYLDAREDFDYYTEQEAQLACSVCSAVRLA